MYPYRSDHWGYFCVWRRFSKQETKCANRCGPCAQLPLGPARGCVHATGAPRGGQGSAPASVLPAAGRPRTWAEGQHAPSLLGNVGQTVRASYKSYRRWEVIWLGAKDASYLNCCSMVVFILFIYLFMSGQEPYPWIHQQYCFITPSAKMSGCWHYANTSAIISNDMEGIMLACQKASSGKNK